MANPLFDCSAITNSYYGWNIHQLQNHVSIIANFTSHFHSMNVVITFLVSTSSNVSVPTSLQYFAFNLNGSFLQSDQNNMPTNLPEGPYHYDFTLSSDDHEMFNGVVIDIFPNATFQWVAIGRIIFCTAANEGLLL